MNRALFRREIGELADRLARSERVELRIVALKLRHALAGEPYSHAHHANTDYDPFRCAACVPDLWVVYVLGIAFPDATTDDVAALFDGMHGLSHQDVALALEAGQNEHTSPDVTRAWLAMRDRQFDEEIGLRAAHEPGWHKIGHHWARSGDPSPNPKLDALLKQLGARHHAERERFVREHGRLRAETELLAEIRAANAAIDNAL